MGVSSPSPEKAYAALSSLVHTIRDLLGNLPLETLPALRPALDHACSLQSTLEECREGVGDLDEQIIMEAARKLEDAIEFPLLSQPPTFSSNLDDDINCFVKTTRKRKQIIEGLWEQKAAKEIEENIDELLVQKPSKPDQEEEEEEEEEEGVEMVGLCDQFLQIKEQVLTAHEEIESSDLFERVIWISGMAGVGKTALAKKVFHDPLIKTKFQSRSFIRVGVKFGSADRILKAIIDQLNLDNGGKTQKSLLFLDDVWDRDLIYHLFHETRLQRERGIVVMLTSRLEKEEYSSYFGMKMRFMDEKESWELLKRKVFGEEECPPQLVKAGKKIAEKCEGLPLLINTVAPILLSKAQENPDYWKNPEYWNKVAEKPDAVLEEASLLISQVLLKSYYQIKEDEKLCFLYIASFPLSCVVPRSTIINLWFAEGFTKYTGTYDVLIGNNIVIDCKKSWSEVEAFRLHCSYWYVSRREAENNKFLYVIKSYADDLNESIKSHRRFAIQENILLAIKDVHNKIATITNVRSLLCTGPYNQYEVPICWEWKLLRVLRVLTIRFYEFPVEVLKLIRLKYLALTCNANLPASISNLSNLEFLIVHQHLNVKRVGARSYLPVEIWYLKKLIHLEVPGRNLPNPPRCVFLHNLEGLLGVGVESCTKGVLHSLRRLKKLRIQIELVPDAPQTSIFFNPISSYSSFYLESFQSVIVNPTLSSPPPLLLNLGLNLKRLSLGGFGYPWYAMSKIAEMRLLEELKLECYAFQGEKWEAEEMKFPNLNYLLIEDTNLVQWTSGDKTFMRLRKLTMKNCHKLREVPLGLYVELELVDCNPLAETWAKQCYDCRVTYSWKEKVKSHDDF